MLLRETGLVLEEDYKYEDLFGKEASKVLKVSGDVTSKKNANIRS